MQDRGDGGRRAREGDDEESEVGSFKPGALKGGYVMSYWGTKPKTAKLTRYSNSEVRHKQKSKCKT